jgi:hypothetical protein
LPPRFFLSSDGWYATKARILATNALQCRTATSAIRMEWEMRQRLQLLTLAQLMLLVEAPAEDRAVIAWLAACKHSASVFDFALMVLRDKLGVHDPVLRLREPNLAAPRSPRASDDPKSSRRDRHDTLRGVTR